MGESLHVDAERGVAGVVESRRESCSRHQVLEAWCSVVGGAVVAARTRPASAKAVAAVAGDRGGRRPPDPAV